MSGASLVELKQAWAESVLRIVNLEIEVVGRPSAEGPLLFVGNHVSYLDIPLLLRSVPQLSFVAKRELSRWPIFGDGARAMQTVFVDRACPVQRQAARTTITEALKLGLSIAIFPSGTTSMDESAPWRKGAFEISKFTGARIQPFSIRYEPQATVAFLGEDSFVTHVIRLLGERRLKARLEFHPPVHVNDPVACSDHWRLWTRRTAQALPE